jgi:hypothetical protein
VAAQIKQGAGPYPRIAVITPVLGVIAVPVMRSGESPCAPGPCASQYRNPPPETLLPAKQTIHEPAATRHGNFHASECFSSAIRAPEQAAALIAA